ncbi:MAG: hypothetical protein IKC97_04995 [Clostridia bacterium]|nr:hypothetical protein [Clostridia bacterium]
MEKSRLSNKKKLIFGIVIAAILATVIMASSMMYLIYRMNLMRMHKEYTAPLYERAIAYVQNETDVVERYGEDLSLKAVKTQYKFINDDWKEAQSAEEYEASLERVVLYVRLKFFRDDCCIVTMETDGQGKLIIIGHEWGELD